MNKEMRYGRISAVSMFAMGVRRSEVREERRRENVSTSATRRQERQGQRRRRRRSWKLLILSEIVNHISVGAVSAKARGPTAERKSRRKRISRVKRGKGRTTRVPVYDLDLPSLL